MLQQKTVLPNIYLFNPTCDFAIANGSANWQPNKTLQKMESDLATLPMYFSQKNDVVLVDKLPGEKFIQSFNRLDFEMPEFVLKNEIQKNNLFLISPVNAAIPWGWSPAAHKLFDPLKPLCSLQFRESPVFRWLPEHREISSRKFAASILQDLSEKIPKDWIQFDTQFPKICFSKPDVERAIGTWKEIMLKAPWSSSGRGLQPITKLPVHEKVWEKINAIINDQGFVMAEPLFKKVHDMAFLFELKKGKCLLIGRSHFFTNSKGQYEGNWLNGLPENFNKTVSDFISGVSLPITEAIQNCIEKSSMAENYEGVFGVDTLIYTDDDGTLKINPCLEINTRHTMGMLAIQLEKLIAPGANGIFKTFYQPGRLFAAYKKDMEQKHPLKIENGKITSGFFALTPAGNCETFGAFLII